VLQKVRISKWNGNSRTTSAQNKYLRVKDFKNNKKEYQMQNQEDPTWNIKYVNLKLKKRRNGRSTRGVYIIKVSHK
jgi:hypothetical protein